MCVLVKLNFSNPENVCGLVFQYLTFNKKEWKPSSNWYNLGSTKAVSKGQELEIKFVTLLLEVRRKE